jgi:hypothetical protein
MDKRRLTGLFTLRRLRLARLLGLEKPQSGYSPFVRFYLRHSFVALALLRKSLFGLQNRRKQPERYTTFALNSIMAHKYIF